MINGQTDDQVFENEVRRIARQLWPADEYGGAQTIRGQERDGVFETEECFHLVEATTSQKKEKAEKDIGKLVALASTFQKKNPSKAVKCWFITKHEPTGDQRNVAVKHKQLVNALSFSQFQSKLVDAKTYLSLRENHAFGSVRDPATGDINPAIEYVPLDLLENQNDKLWSVEAICDSILAGERFIILGDYGAGKSMTLRQVYRNLRKRYFTDKITCFPIYINLRDHFGQTNAAEVLERHARDIGFPTPSHLVRAWRAGYAILLIDGFDEITTVGIQGLWKRLQDTRYRAMQGVREFMRGHPASIGLAIAGRAHFFDSEKERNTALELSESAHRLSLSDFSTEQIKQYLSKSGLAGQIPNWLPSRPLLLGYLAAKGLLADVIEAEELPNGNTAMDPAVGWDYILNRISEREARIEAGIDGRTVRRILERLATIARTSQDGLGPLSPDDVIRGFKEICGYAPDERGMILLQRLPGLGIDRPDEQTRRFIDEDLADICRAGDVFEYIQYPYDFDLGLFRDSECALINLGLCTAARRLNSAGCTEAKINASLEQAHNKQAPEVIKADIARILIEGGWKIEKPVTLRKILIPFIEFDENTPDCSSLVFQECYFPKIDLERNAIASQLPRFKNCYIGEIDGRLSRRDLPEGIFDEGCVIDRFVSSDKTTKSLMDLDLPDGTRVMLTILKKLYQQSGSGRKEKALMSGLDHHARRLVPAVLRLLQAEGVAIPYRKGTLLIWLPERSNMTRVARIISAPTESDDPLLEKSHEFE